MSDDIVETLHNLAQTRTYDDRIGRALRSAADEIERLRAENANLQWQLDFANDCLSKAAGLLSGED